MVAVVRRTILDNVRFTVRAKNPDDAYSKAKEFLAEFPNKTFVDGVDWAFIENRENLESEVLDLGMEK